MTKGKPPWTSSTANKILHFFYSLFLQQDKDKPIKHFKIKGGKEIIPISKEEVELEQGLEEYKSLL